MRASTTSILQFVLRLLASLIGFATTVYFTRTLGTDLIGIYFLVVSLATWLRFVTAPGLYTAVKKRISEGEDGGEYLSTGILLQAAGVLVVSLLVFAFEGQVDAYLDRGGLVGLLVALLFGNSFFRFGQDVLRGEHRVATASILTFGERILRAVIQFGLVLFGFKVGGLVGGYTASTILAILVTVAIVSTKPAKPSWEKLRDLASYARYSWFSNLESLSSMWADTLVLGFFVSNSLVGIYNVSWMFASLLGLAGAAISQALFPEISRHSVQGENDDIRDVVELGVAMSGVVAIPGTVGAAVLAPDLLQVYGPEYRLGAAVLAYHAVYFLGSSYAGQFVSLLYAMDRPELAFRVSFASVALNLSLNVVFVWAFGWVGAAVATAITMVLMLVYAYYQATRILEFEVNYAAILKQSLAAVVMGVGVFGASATLEFGPELLRVLAIVGAGAILYFGLLYVLSPLFRNVIWETVPESRFTPR